RHNIENQTLLAHASRHSAEPAGNNSGFGITAQQGLIVLLQQIEAIFWTGDEAIGDVIARVANIEKPSPRRYVRLARRSVEQVIVKRGHELRGGGQTRIEHLALLQTLDAQSGDGPRFV